jgi:hypothetical protein
MKLVTRPNFFIVFIPNTVFRREGDEGTKAIKKYEELEREMAI